MNAGPTEFWLQILHQIHHNSVMGYIEAYSFKGRNDGNKNPLNPLKPFITNDLPDFQTFGLQPLN